MKNPSITGLDPSTSTSWERAFSVSRFQNAKDKHPHRVTFPSWGALVDHLLARDFDPVDLTAARRAADDTKKHDNAVDTLKRKLPAWSPATFSGTRARDNAVAVSCAVLDLDGLDDAGLADISKRCAPYAHVVCSTFSHGWKKAGHAVRVALPFSRDVRADEWTRVWEAVNLELAGGRNDAQTKDASRLYFLPAMPREAPDLRTGLSPMEAWQHPIAPAPLQEIHDGAPIDVDALLARHPAPAPRPIGNVVALRPIATTDGDPNSRTGRRVAAYFEKAKRDELEAVRSAPEGTRNHRLNVAALNLARMARTAEHAEVRGVALVSVGGWRAELAAAAQAAGLHDDETEATIESGWTCDGAKAVRVDVLDKVRAWRAEQEREEHDDDDAGELVADDDATVPMQRDLITGEYVAASKPRLVVADDNVPQVSDEAVAALARLPNVYQRTGRLVTVAIEAGQERGGVKREGAAPRIVPIKRGHLVRLLCDAAEWRKRGKDVLLTTTPPDRIVNSIADAPAWDSVRHLTGFVEAPTLRPDGTILDSHGYDAQTGLFLFIDKRCTVPKVADNPTRDDVKAAADLLLDLVSDFPFKADVHRAAWIAALLTPLARHAFNGPAPLFLMDANNAGTGKTMLADLISIIATGRVASRVTAPTKNEEARKLITTVALDGDALVLVDNIVGAFGGGVWDAALTAPSWKDRLLGANESVDVPLRMTWIASGNNVTLRGDTHRRVAHIRLESELEAPDKREGFKRPDLLAYARQARGELLHAALTILRAFHAAGRPALHLTPWGSFDGWTGTVRAAIVHAGLPDPSIAREELRSTADSTRAALGVALGLWDSLGSKAARGISVAELVKALETDEHAELRQAFEEMGADPTSGASLAGTLRRHKGTPTAGRAFDTAPGRGGTVRWVVRGVISPDPGPESGGVGGVGGVSDHRLGGKKIDPEARTSEGGEISYPQGRSTTQPTPPTPPSDRVVEEL